MTFTQLVICILIAALIVAVALYMLRRKDPAQADELEDEAEDAAKAAGGWIARMWAKLRGKAQG